MRRLSACTPAARAATLATLCALLLPGCLIGSDQRSRHTGHYVSEETLAELRPGASEDFVLQLLGEPSDRLERDDVDLWRWDYALETKSSGSVLFLVSSSSRSEAKGTVWVRLRDGIVERAWRDAPPASA